MVSGIFNEEVYSNGGLDDAKRYIIVGIKDVVNVAVDESCLANPQIPQKDNFILGSIMIAAW